MPPKINFVNLIIHPVKFIISIDLNAFEANRVPNNKLESSKFSVMPDLIRHDGKTYFLNIAG
jgi:hypothetical protein